MALGAGGEAVFRKPDGGVIPEAPPLPPVQGDPFTAFEALLAAEDVAIDPRAWDGGPVDYGAAVEHVLTL